ncbi:hypothetical protein CRU98_01490 [Arcobacter sp. CECT 8986]|uniref:M48 family metallopeptidase n=1 Tax=Arcobacter sp. CECT 8986 TaxID=2044507 RepID=UPI001009AE0F|nr:SprT family zinc-dependent metalloprotease [Arcobacter sp. CECT 8986]RXK01148.1 hypothetical protein CRU98_01490 [Arcobacter sp. CECT 8986]
MEYITTIANLKINVKVHKKHGLKYTYIRIKTANSIEVKTNYYLSKYDIEDIVQKKSQWIYKNILTFKQNSLEENEFYFLGVKHKNLDDRNIDIFYKNEAKKIIPPIVEKFSNIMQLFPSSIKFRKNKRTWGSCNYKDDLNFNILLVKFPIEVVEYVVIHELAHIKHKNHSKNFWQLVFEYCPDYKQREKLLKSFL